MNIPPLSNFDIMDMGYKVYMRDKIPKNPKTCIINLDDSDGPGTHWTALYYDKSKDRYDYFDSFGFIYPEELEQYNIHEYNEIMIQNRATATCGYFAVYYLRMREAGHSPYDIIYKKLIYEPVDVITEYFQL